MRETRRNRKFLHNSKVKNATCKKSTTKGQESHNKQSGDFAQAADRESRLQEGVLGLDASAVYKIKNAFVSLTRLVTDDSSSSHIDSDNLATATSNSDSGKIHRKGKLSTGIDHDVEGGLHDRHKQSSAVPSPARNVAVSRNLRRKRLSKKLPSQSKQMDPIIEVANRTTSQSDEGEVAKRVASCSMPEHKTSRGMRRLGLRSKIQSTDTDTSESNHTVSKSKDVPLTEKGGAITRSRTNRPLPKARRKHDTDSTTHSESSDNPNTPLLSRPTGELRDATQSPREFEDTRRHATELSDGHISSPIIYERVSLPTESFYSNLSNETPRLTTWLKTAGRYKNSTPAEAVVKSKRVDSFREKGWVIDPRGIDSVHTVRGTDRPVWHKSTISEESSQLLSHISCRAISKDYKTNLPRSSVDSNGDEVITITKASKISSSSSEMRKLDMKTVNSKTPAGRVCRSALKNVNSSTPHPVQQKEIPVQTEYIFGFENLLEPAASLLQEVSPIPQPPLPSQSRKRKEQRVQNIRQKQMEAHLNEGTINTNARGKRRNLKNRATTVSRRRAGNHTEKGVVLGDEAGRCYEFDKIVVDTGSEGDTPLFEVAPITPYTPFKIKEVTTFDVPVKPPAKTNDGATKMARYAVPFDIEEALPWNDIMEHELVIESA